MKKLALALLSVLFASGALAQDYDVAVSGYNWLCAIDPPFVRDGVEFSPGGAVEENTSVRSIAAAGNGRILAAIAGTDVEIVELRSDLTRRPFFAGVSGSVARLLVADAAGTVYVIATTGNVPSLLEISPAGALVSNQPFPYLPRSIDLAADQCTLFAATGSNAILRYDVCTRTPLSSFVSLPFGSTSQSLRILPDGGLLVAANDDILRYDAAGTVVRTYDLGNYEPGALALGNGGSTILTGANCEAIVFEIDLATGAILREIPQQFVDRTGTIVARGGFTAAIGALAATDVPLRGPIFLLTLGLALAFGAVWKLH
jgi:hypothetical protein